MGDVGSNARLELNRLAGRSGEGETALHEALLPLGVHLRAVDRDRRSGVARGRGRTGDDEPGSQQPRDQQIWAEHQKIVLLLRNFDSTAFANYGHLDLAGIFELVLDLARDLMREEDGAVIVDLGRLDHHANLASRL